MFPSLFRQYRLPVLGSPIRKSWYNNAFYQLYQAYRRFIRPSSDIQVKASTLCYILILVLSKIINYLLIIFDYSKYFKEQNKQNTRRKIYTKQ